MGRPQLRASHCFGWTTVSGKPNNIWIYCINIGIIIYKHIKFEIPKTNLSESCLIKINKKLDKCM